MVIFPFAGIPFSYAGLTFYFVHGGFRQTMSMVALDQLTVAFPGRLHVLYGIADVVLGQRSSMFLRLKLTVLNAEEFAKRSKRVRGAGQTRPAFTRPKIIRGAAAPECCAYACREG